jgi:hypothetical protein
MRRVALREPSDDPRKRQESQKYLGRFGRDRPLWSMEIVGAGKEKTKTTNLWRHEGLVCQFIPTERAVLDLLNFLGFKHAEFLLPKETALEPRFYKRERGTFLAVRAA